VDEHVPAPDQAERGSADREPLGLADNEADPLPPLSCLPSLVCDLDMARHRVDAA
jgi:hypothetical protein